MRRRYQSTYLRQRERLCPDFHAVANGARDVTRRRLRLRECRTSTGGKGARRLRRLHWALDVHGLFMKMSALLVQTTQGAYLEHRPHCCFPGVVIWRLPWETLGCRRTGHPARYEQGTTAVHVNPCRRRAGRADRKRMRTSMSLVALDGLRTCTLSSAARKA